MRTKAALRPTLRSFLCSQSYLWPESRRCLSQELPQGDGASWRQGGGCRGARAPTQTWHLRAAIAAPPGWSCQAGLDLRPAEARNINQRPNV